MTAEPWDGVLPEVRTTVEAGPMRVFTLLTADPNPIHFDVAAVRAAGLGDRLVNQGGLNVAYVVRAITRWAGSSAALREVRVRFLGNVFDGDEVTAGGEVADGEGSRVRLRVWLRGPGGTEVLTGTATVDLPVCQARKG
ncbi:MaoC family dehydratase [Acrocarpospora catenulata]|uniref:MaoC family dehydratase n=1 Tax=Acrocarpospora catenulata TaxID=2836182 RepID=UPI001BD95C16|nr:MaoC/PaaZ C-terminal domain-containing protein [Acrocarpospora catenulata]